MKSTDSVPLRPVLKRNVKIKTRSLNRVVLEHLDEEVILEGRGAELFCKLAEYLNGESGLDQLALKVGESPTRVEAFINELGKSGVTAWMAEEMTGLEFYELHRKYSNYWLRPVYDHPFWERMTSGQATRAQVLGFAFEKYHYIEGAHEHMAVAAANATPEMMPHLARHFIEEYSHGDIYRKGLRSLFPDELVLCSQPLPSTRALINFLAESAARNSFAYYAGNEVLQMTENTGDEAAAGSVDDFYAAMRRHYPYTGKLVDSFIAHTSADQKLGHESVFKEMCGSVPKLNRHEVTDAMNTAKSMTEHLVLFLDGIEAWYGRNEAIPRVPCSLLSE